MIFSGPAGQRLLPAQGILAAVPVIAKMGLMVGGQLVLLPVALTDLVVNLADKGEADGVIKADGVRS
jgi:hypothetical protein